MRNKATPPVYSQVAYDIATKIATGVLEENSRFSGRSLMSTEYSVSQETIRRAMKQLADMGIIEIQQSSGAIVISREKASKYIDKFKSSKDLRSLKNELRALLAQREAMDQRIMNLIEQITNLNERFIHSDPLKNYEFEILPNSKLVGKSIKDSEFRLKTQAIIVAIRSEEEIDLSPGPDTLFKPYDILVVAGSPSTVDKVRELIQ